MSATVTISGGWTLKRSTAADTMPARRDGRCAGLETAEGDTDATMPDYLGWEQHARRRTVDQEIQPAPTGSPALTPGRDHRCRDHGLRPGRLRRRQRRGHRPGVRGGRH